jgi:hypothetical protein
VQVLSAEFVQRQLQLAENEFLSHSVEIDVSKNEVGYGGIITYIS